MRAGRDLSPAGLRRLIGLIVPTALALASLFALSSTASAQSRYVSFDPPGSVQTYVSGINKSGQVVGGYRDSSSNHSFLRNTDGSIISFDPPGANYSTATSINNNGEITGYWYGTAPGYEGYYRDAAGNFTTFVIPSTKEDWTFPWSINDGGSIIGYAANGSGQNYNHGFIRDPSGTLTIFDPPGSIETFGETINRSGFISGAYYDSASVLHGFILDPAGNYAIVDVPGASGQGTLSAAINDRGQLTGEYSDSRFVLHGYLRSAVGAYSTFDAPGAFLTQAAAINNLGQIVGIENKRSGLDAGFVRENSGHITIFQVPGAGLGQEQNQGTASVAINSSGTVVGYYYDTNKVPHGFIRY